MMRLDKMLSACGAGTRSEVKKLIKSRAVTVNGTVAEQPKQSVDENADTVLVNGKPVVYEKFRYYVFHKPKGCVTAVTDSRHRTVMDFFPEELRSGLSPVGRLDLDTEGLLIVTDDGELLHHCISPSHHMEKTYFARLDTPVPKEAVEKFGEGVDIGDPKPTLPAVLSILPVKTDESGNPCYTAELTIREGRFHQVKRMFEAVGCHVVYLKRLSMGPLGLGALEKGAYRRLTEEEVEALKKL